MKHLRFSDKLIFIVNSLAAFLLLLSYILPYVPPKSFAFLSVLSLGVPLLIILNLLFGLYWLLKLKKQVLLSSFVLLIGFQYINTMYKFSSSKVESENNFSVMSYNVRLFNVFDWLPSKTVKQDIFDFIKNENPDVLCLQEYHQKEPINIPDYYKYESLSDGKIKSGQAIFSKFPIVNSGAVKFPKTANDAIFVDIVKRNDTIRVYNLHLQSSGINTDIDKLKKENSGDVFNQVSTTFKAQQTQTELFLEHKKQCSYKSIIAGDFNNTNKIYT